MSKKRYLITVTDNLSATSMPLNEFVLYRRSHFPEEEQVVFLLFKTNADESVKIPGDIKVYSIGKNRKLLAEAMKDVEVRAESEQASLVVHIHEAKSVLFFNLATWFKYRNRIVYTLHSTYKNYPLHNKVFCLGASMMSRKIVCVSNTSLKYYPKLFKRVLGDKVEAIPNGVDLERINRVRKDNKNTVDTRHFFTAIYVARLVPLKRHKILMDAIRYLPGVKMVFIGTGPLGNELQQYAKSIGIEKQVQFLGLMPREDVFRHLLDADLYVSSSSYEGLPVGVLEAMACGKPCLVSDIEQHKEIKANVNTLYTCGETPENWAEKLEILMLMKQEQLKEIGETNLRGVMDNYSLEEMHRRYETDYALCGN